MPGLGARKAPNKELYRKGIAQATIGHASPTGYVLGRPWLELPVRSVRVEGRTWLFMLEKQLFLLLQNRSNPCTLGGGDPFSISFLLCH